MYKYKHFLGYGVIIPAHELKKSPYRTEKLEEFRKKNYLIYLDKFYTSRETSDKMFIGYLLDYKDDNFSDKLKESEKHLNDLYYEIMKMDIPQRYKQSLYAKHGDIWEEE